MNSTLETYDGSTQLSNCTIYNFQNTNFDFSSSISSGPEVSAYGATASAGSSATSNDG